MMGSAFQLISNNLPNPHSINWVTGKYFTKKLACSRYSENKFVI